MKNLLTSSITSIYKSKKFLENFEQQLRTQTFFKNIEIILVDCNDDSDDFNVIEKLCKEPNVKYFKLNPDPGVIGAWNKGLEYVTTDYATHSNTDDVKAPWYFETMYRYMEQNPECDVAYGPVGKSLKAATPFYEDFTEELWQCLKTNLSTMLVENSPHCMPTWRRSLHDELGFFDEKYDIKADFEFWLRCLKNKKRFDKLNIVMGNYYFNPQGNSTKKTRKKRSDRQHNEIIQKYYHDEPFSVFEFYHQIVAQNRPTASSKMIIKR